MSGWNGATLSQLLTVLPFIVAKIAQLMHYVGRGWASQLLTELPFIEAVWAATTHTARLPTSQLLTELPFIEATARSR